MVKKFQIWWKIQTHRSRELANPNHKINKGNNTNVHHNQVSKASYKNNNVKLYRENDTLHTE